MQLPRFSRLKGRTRISVIAFAYALLIAIAFNISAIGSGIDNSLRDSRDNLRISPASGTIAIVEIDGRSLQALDRYPWPRRHYATAVKELDRLGAEQIAFDVDFSSRSDPEEDALFAKALEELGQPVILPTFRQLNNSGDTQTVSEALPIEELREQAFLASVNVFPSANGQVIMYPHGVTTNDTPRPSLPNMMAKTGGEVGASFRIDQAIDVSTIPRISFIDLIEGRVPAEAVRGKRVVFGATAIELGDRYPTAQFGVQPGVVVQAQAAETLLQDRVRSEASPWLVLGVFATLLGGLFALRGTLPAKTRNPAVATVVLTSGLVTIALALDQAALPYLPIAGALVFALAFVGTERALNAAADLKRERMTDTASGLPNRAAMQDAVRRKPGAAIAVARLADHTDIVSMLGMSHLADLDCEIAKRLELVADNATVYRIESGLFGWLISEAQAAETPISDLFDSARALFSGPVTIGGERFQLGVSFGYSQSNIASAINASSSAARQNSVWSADADHVQQAAQRKQRIIGSLDAALENGEIHVVYQPKLRLIDEEITGAECLARWDSKQLGRLSPADFIPILEEKGRIEQLTRFVMDEAVRNARAAQISGKPLNLAVNVSAQLLSNDQFVEDVAALVQELLQDGPDSITLEITESAPLTDSSKARAAIERWGKAGARISIDDYGTGQATLNYLQGFPAHELKLDQSFVRDMAFDRKDQIMVQSTLELARALGFDVVAEGVEDQETLDTLCTMGCDYVQGWHIGKPMAWDDLIDLVNKGESHNKAA